MKPCFNCGEVGHLARNCPFKDAELVNGVYVSGRVFFRNERRTSVESSNNRKCFRCNMQGHMAKDCEISEMVCYRCGNEGHIGKNCVNSNQKRLCYECGADDHLYRDCTNYTNNFEDYSEAASSTEHIRSKKMKRKRCFFCKQLGHFARLCPEKSPKPKYSDEEEEQKNWADYSIENDDIQPNAYKIPFQKGFSTSNSKHNFQNLCHRCEQPGHFARDCTY